MPNLDFADARSEKSVPPKKLHYWRLQNITLPEQPTLNSVFISKDTVTDCAWNLPLNMGPNSLQPGSQIDNGHEFGPLSSPKNIHVDMPLDFSVKPESKRSLSEKKETSSQGRQSIKINSYDHFRISNGERNGGRLSHISYGTDQSFNPNTYKTVPEPVKTVVSPKKDINDYYYYDVSNSADLSDRNVKLFSDRQRMNSPSPRSQCPSSSSKSPILADTLTVNPYILSAMPVEFVSSERMPLGFQNRYINGFGSIYVPSAIQNPNSVIASSPIFPPNKIVSPTNLALLQSKMNLLPSVSPIQSKIENKAMRKVKQERPFKNYDVNLQGDVKCNTSIWPFIPSTHPRPVDESIPSDASHSESVAAPNRTRSTSVNGNSENSLNSELSKSPSSVVNELDNTPHSSVSNNDLEETADTENGRSRKRKPVAESEKDALYWERRKKNNEAAKRSRENRRMKEDAVASDAFRFRTENEQLRDMLVRQYFQIEEIARKITNLNEEKVALITENALYKQKLQQKRCGQCGNMLSNNMS